MRTSKYMHFNNALYKRAAEEPLIFAAKRNVHISKDGYTIEPVPRLWLDATYPGFNKGDVYKDYGYKYNFVLVSDPYGLSRVPIKRGTWKYPGYPQGVDLVAIEDWGGGRWGISLIIRNRDKENTTFREAIDAFGLNEIIGGSSYD